MKKFLTFAILLCCLVGMTSATPDFHNESVTYKVMYKWGLINKKAGEATITMQRKGNRYSARLVAASEPWADRFYQVRDTLLGTIDAHTMMPLEYQKIAHEGNEDKHDVVKFSRSGNNVTGHTTRKVIKKGVLKIDDKRTLQATGPTVDMLSSYFYMRSLPFQDWKPGHEASISIFSGKAKEKLTFKYHGIETLSLDGTDYRCYHITFIFTGDGGKKTSDDMDAWITTDTRRLPVQLEGKLPVGKVRCQLVKSSH